MRERCVSIYYSKWDDRLNTFIFNTKHNMPCYLYAREEDELPENIIILEMYRVDMDIVEKAHKLFGNRLRIRVQYGQEKKRKYDYDYPLYTYRHIVKTEKNIDTYNKSMQDYYDKDGDLKSLSPLEKFYASWILSTKCGKYWSEPGYTKHQKNYHVSRSVYEIFATMKKRRIVCGGYSNVEREFLYRNGITRTASISFYYVNEPRNNLGLISGHAMTLVYIDDPKYHVKGVYLSDPTAGAVGLTHNSISHSLMSYEEVNKRYRSNGFKLDLKSVQYYSRGNNDICDYEIDGDLKLDNFDELYHNQIPEMTIAKAFIAINRFLDRNMKMAKDDSEYTTFEIVEMAYKLYLISIIDDEDLKKRLIEEGLKMRPSELRGYSYATRFVFLMNVLNVLEYSSVFYSVNYWEDENNSNNYRFELRAYSLLFNQDIIDELSKKWKQIEDTKAFVLYKLTDEPFGEQLEHLKEICEQFYEDYSKICGNNKNKGVK